MNGWIDDRLDYVGLDSYVCQSGETRCFACSISIAVEYAQSRSIDRSIIRAPLQPARHLIVLYTSVQDRYLINYGRV